MSLLLNIDPKTTEGAEIKTHSWPERIEGAVEIRFPGSQQVNIGYKDFAHLVHYVLTNTDLKQDDPRAALVEAIGRMKKVKGYGGPSTERFDGPFPK